MNIYDLAGNVNEWTLETNTSITIRPCAVRGGYYEHTGYDTPASSRGSSNAANSYGYVGLRPSLY